MSGSVDRCYIAGSVKSQQIVGGIAGNFQTNTNYKISNCYSDAVVSSSLQSLAGGLVGQTEFSVIVGGQLDITNNFVTVWPAQQETAILGSAPTASDVLSHNFFPSSTPGTPRSGTAPLAANNPNYASLFSNGGYDTASVWLLSTADKWPTLRGLTGPTLVPTPIL